MTDAEGQAPEGVELPPDTVPVDSQTLDEPDEFIHSYTTNRQAVTAGLKARLAQLNSLGITVREPVNSVNIRDAWAAAIDAEKIAQEDGARTWRTSWGGEVPLAMTLWSMTPPERPQQRAPESEAAEATLRRIFQTGASGSLPVRRARTRGLGFLTDAQVHTCERALASAAFPGARGKVVMELIIAFRSPLALTLAHTGTSPEMDFESVHVPFKFGGTQGLVDIGTWLRWMVQQGEDDSGSVTLRKYAKTMLADLAYYQLKHSADMTPFVAKYGYSHQNKDIAFDFASGITIRLHDSKYRVMASARAVAVKRSSFRGYTLDDNSSDI